MVPNYDAEIEALSRLSPRDIHRIWKNWVSPLFAACCPVGDMFNVARGHYASSRQYVGCPSLIQHGGIEWADPFGIKERLPPLPNPLLTGEIRSTDLAVFKAAQEIVDGAITNRWALKRE